MMTIDLFAPTGALTDDELAKTSRELIEGLVPGEHGPKEVIDAMRSLTHVLVHQPQTSMSGTATGEFSEGQRFLVRVTVPEGWREEMSRHVISTVNRVLTGALEHSAAGPHVTVQVIGVSDGSLGLFGEAVTAADILRYVTRGTRTDSGGLPSPLTPDGDYLDPICGMSVPRAYASSTLEVNGRTYGFCSTACGDLFGQEQDVATAK